MGSPVSLLNVPIPPVCWNWPGISGPSKIDSDFWRDVRLGEDACQVRKGSAPHALAVLNSFVLALFDFCGITNVKQQMRRLDAQPLQAVRLLVKSLGEN